jgi:hypothetical protein
LVLVYRSLIMRCVLFTGPMSTTELRASLRPLKPPYLNSPRLSHLYGRRVQLVGHAFEAFFKELDATRLVELGPS